MPIKTKNPKIRTATTFDIIDVFDIRFKRIKGTWKAMAKYDLINESGESFPGIKEKQIEISSSEIKKMQKLIATIVDGIEY